MNEFIYEVLHFLFDKIWLLSVDFQLNKSDNTLLRAANRAAPGSAVSFDENKSDNTLLRAAKWPSLLPTGSAVSFDENKRVKQKSEIVKGEIQNSKKSVKSDS